MTDLSHSPSSLRAGGDAPIPAIAVGSKQKPRTPVAGGAGATRRPRRDVEWETMFRLDTLLGLGREIGRASEEQGLLRIALGTLMGTAGAGKGVALGRRPEDGQLRVVCALGVEEDVNCGIDTSDHALCEALLRPLLVGPAARGGPSAIREFARRLARQGFGLWVPLVAEGDILGGLCLGPRFTAQRYRAGEIRLLGAIADHCAASLNGIRQFAMTLSAQERMFRLQALLEEHLDPQVVGLLLEDSQSCRQTASVLVADLRGFTALSEELEPEAVVDVLNQFLKGMTRVLNAHNGIIDKFIGDAVMAYFLEPETAPLRAVQCALEMERAFRERPPVPQGTPPGRFSLGVGIGISTGEVVVGHIGGGRRQDWTVIGSTVNLAHRLSKIPRNGTCVDTRTFAGAEEHVWAKLLPDVSIKGIERRTSVYELLHLRESPEPVIGSPQGTTAVLAPPLSDA